MSNEQLHLISHQFNPEALRLARELRGFQKIDLAAELDVSPSAITQFENGAIKPNTKTVAKMSLALGFPASFFAQKDLQNVSTDQCHFRKFQSSSQTERRKMVGVSTIVGKFIDFIEEFIDLPEERVTLHMKARPSNLDDIEIAAAELRREWGLGIGPIANLVDLLELNGIIVLRLLEDCDRVDAFSLYYKRRPVVFLNTRKGCASRTRFDAAHELGHLVLHGDCKPGDEDQEREADAFASAFLLPRAGFLPESPRRLVWAHLVELKERWRVSLLALVRRLRDLGIYSDHTYKRAHIQYNQMGFRSKEPAEPPIEWPSTLHQSLEVMNEIGWDLARIADHLSIAPDDLIQWIYADFPEQEQDDPPFCLPDVLVSRRRLREEM